MKQWLPWMLIVLIAIICGFSISQKLENDARHRRAVAILRDSLHVLADSSQALAARDTILQANADSIRAELSATRRQLLAYSIQNGAYQATLDSLIRTIPDTHTSAQIGEAIASLRGEVATCNAALTQCDSLTAVLDRRIDLHIARNGTLSATISTLRAAWEAAERRARDKPFGVGVTCGLAGNQLGFGWGCAAGVTYRMRLSWPF